METSLKEIVDRQFQKAVRKLDNAQKIFDEALYEDAISRAYYAIFHASKALLQTQNLEAKSHSGVITLLNQYFIKGKKLDVRFGKIFTYAKELRENGDYDAVFEAGKEDAEMVLSDAKEFLETVKKLLASL